MEVESSTLVPFPEELEEKSKEFLRDAIQKDHFKEWLIASKNIYQESIDQYNQFKFMPEKEAKIKTWSSYVKLVEKKLEELDESQ